MPPDTAPSDTTTIAPVVSLDEYRANLLAKQRHDAAVQGLLDMIPDRVEFLNEMADSLSDVTLGAYVAAIGADYAAILSATTFRPIFHKLEFPISAITPAKVAHSTMRKACEVLGYSKAMPYRIVEKAIEAGCLHVLEGKDGEKPVKFYWRVPLCPNFERVFVPANKARLWQAWWDRMQHSEQVKVLEAFATNAKNLHTAHKCMGSKVWADAAIVAHWKATT